MAETVTGDVPIKKLHAPVPLQAFPQPVNRAPAPADWVMTTVEPSGKFAVHVPGQLIPAGVLVNVPDPFATADTEI